MTNRRVWTWPEFRDRLVPVGACLEFRGSRDNRGYGQVWHAGRLWRAHRLAWHLANESEIPSGRVVMHGCDNKVCCNPAHLTIGTVAQNTRDAFDRGLATPIRGSANRSARLTEHDVICIRARGAAGESQRSLARSFGVGHRTIEDVLHRLRWAHV